eukprot:gene11087-7715_t
MASSAAGPPPSSRSPPPPADEAALREVLEGMDSTRRGTSPRWLNVQPCVMDALQTMCHYAARQQGRISALEHRVDVLTSAFEALLLDNALKEDRYQLDRSLQAAEGVVRATRPTEAALPLAGPAPQQAVERCRWVWRGPAPIGDVAIPWDEAIVTSAGGPLVCSAPPPSDAAGPAALGHSSHFAWPSRGVVRVRRPGLFRVSAAVVSEGTRSCSSPDVYVNQGRVALYDMGKSQEPDAALAPHSFGNFLYMEENSVVELRWDGGGRRQGTTWRGFMELENGENDTSSGHAHWIYSCFSKIFSSLSVRYGKRRLGLYGDHHIFVFFAPLSPFFFLSFPPFPYPMVYQSRDPFGPLLLYLRIRFPLLALTNCCISFPALRGAERKADCVGPATGATTCLYSPYISTAEKHNPGRRFASDPLEQSGQSPALDNVPRFDINQKNKFLLFIQYISCCWFILLRFVLRTVRQEYSLRVCKSEGKEEYFYKGIK